MDTDSHDKNLNQKFQINTNKNLSKISKLKETITIDGVEHVLNNKTDSEDEKFNTIKNIDTITDGIPNEFIKNTCGKDKNTNSNCSYNDNLEFNLSDLSNMIQGIFEQDNLEESINSTVNNTNNMKKKKL